jgi:hypothetical protein
MRLLAQLDYTFTRCSSGMSKCHIRSQRDLAQSFSEFTLTKMERAPTEADALGFARQA